MRQCDGTLCRARPRFCNRARLSVVPNRAKRTGLQPLISHRRSASVSPVTQPTATCAAGGALRNRARLQPCRNGILEDRASAPEGCSFTQILDARFPSPPLAKHELNMRRRASSTTGKAPAFRPGNSDSHKTGLQARASFRAAGDSANHHPTELSSRTRSGGICGCSFVLIRSQISVGQ
jgi:hypothetical protein